jgi:hypothetical protein
VANFSLVLGVSNGRAEVIGEPVAGFAAKQTYKSAVDSFGRVDGKQFQEIWLVDTREGRLRRKGFALKAEELIEAPAKKRGRPPKQVD